MATYKDVQNYSRIHYGWVAQSCWIALAKELIDAPLGHAKRGESDRVKPCPEEKRKQVVAAMRAVGLV